MVVLTRSKAKQVSNFKREVNARTLGFWDQFDANKDLVKGTSKYNEDLYTTPLPPNPSAESLRRADEMVLSITNSREGETPDTGRQKTNTEEELFSSVPKDDTENRRSTPAAPGIHMLIADQHMRGSPYEGLRVGIRCGLGAVSVRSRRGLSRSTRSPSHVKIFPIDVGRSGRKSSASVSLPRKYHRSLDSSCHATEVRVTGTSS